MSDNKGSVFSQDKIFLHGDRLREYLDDVKTKAPITMEMDLTNRCNNNCPACTGYNDDGIQMSTEFARNLIWQVAALGTRGLIFTGGGEPLLHKGLPELMLYAKESGLDTGLITSGQAPKGFGEKELETIVKNASWIRVSLDAGSTEKYRMMHGLPGASHYKALNFINKLCEERDSAARDTTIGVGYLTGAGNPREEQEDIFRAALLAIYAGADYFQLRPLHGSDRDVEMPKILHKFVESANKRTKLLTSAHKYKWMDEKGKRNYDYCHGARFASVITADGILNACCHFRNQPIGHIADLKYSRLKDVWESGLVEKALDKIDVHECVPYCRCDGFNRSIEQMVQGYKHGHKNFL